MNEFQRIDQIIDRLLLEVGVFNDFFGTVASVKESRKKFPEVMGLVESAMIYEIICRTCALFDPASTGRDDNLTIDFLIKSCGNKIDKDLHLRIEALRYDYGITGIKKFRNKSYAHHDLKVKLGKRKLNVEISYEIMSDLLSETKKVVIELGVLVRKVNQEAQISRVIKLPTKTDVKAFVAKLNST